MSDPEKPMRMNAAFMRALSGDAHVRGQRDGEPATAGRTVDQRDHRLRAVPHPPDDVAEAPLLHEPNYGVLDASDGGLLDVDTRAERASRPAQHDHAARRILARRPEVLQEIVHHDLIQRVEPLRTIERHPVRVAAPLDGNGGVARLAHGPASSLRSHRCCAAAWAGEYSIPAGASMSTRSPTCQASGRPHRLPRSPGAEYRSHPVSQRTV